MTRLNDQLANIAKVFAGQENKDSFMDLYHEQATALFNKATLLGYEPEFLELVYVPVAKDITGESHAEKFQNLIAKLHEVRVAKGYKGSEHFQWSPLWEDKAEVFGDFGIKEEEQFFVLPPGGGKGGLFFAGMPIDKQIAKAKEFFAAQANTDYLMPAAYVCAQILRASESENGTKCLLDLLTCTRFPQFSEDGFIEMADGRYVPYASVYYDGQFSLDGSDGDALSGSGLQVVVRE